MAREKHHEAAEFERDAARRRLAARRAREIAAVGAGDVVGLDRFAAKHSLATVDVSGLPALQSWLPSASIMCEL